MKSRMKELRKITYKAQEEIVGIKIALAAGNGETCIAFDNMLLSSKLSKELRDEGFRIIISNSYDRTTIDWSGSEDE